LLGAPRGLGRLWLRRIVPFSCSGHGRPPVREVEGEPPPVTVSIAGKGPSRAGGFLPGLPASLMQSCNVTVAQGMEGDGKKEDLTVLGGASTHRTPKVRSCMELLQRLRQRYLQLLQVVVDVLEGGTHYRDVEDRLRQELDALGRDIVKWVAEACDERLLADAIIGVTPHQRVN